MGIKHLFDIDVAVKYGVNCAILLENIRYWVDKNKANEQNLHDGKYWTYNSKSAFSILFPYMSYKQIRTALDTLRDEGLVETGTFSDNPYDRTLWYTVTEKGLAILSGCNDTISPTGPIRQPYSADTMALQGQCYTDSKPNNKPDNKLEETRVSKDTLPKEKIGKSAKSYPFDEVYDAFVAERFNMLKDTSSLHDAVNDFIAHRADIRKKLTPTALKLNLEKAYRLAEGDYDRTCELILNAVANGWQGIYDDSSYSRRS
ncbi:MAG: hypothetical protein SO157_07065, partial [Bullifex sp.]|nr:hypothetical protein [Bullifex sp.]